MAKRLSSKYNVAVFQTGIQKENKYKTIIISGVPFYRHQDSMINKNIFGLIGNKLYPFWVLYFTINACHGYYRRNMIGLYLLTGDFSR